MAGWQKQPDAPTVQQYLEEAIYSFCQQSPEVIAAGRTDAGVHARGQVVHFDLEDEGKFTPYNIQHGINHHLGDLPVSVLAVEQVGEDFHARFSAVGRHYRYHILNRPAPPAIDINRVWHFPGKLNIEAMRVGAEYLIGNHDFTSFRASECQAKSPIKTLDRIEINRDIAALEDIYFDLSAKSFLHHMVRNIVGSLAMVGCGKWQAEDIRTALEAKDRSKAGPTAPAYGLYFMKVDY